MAAEAQLTRQRADMEIQRIKAEVEMTSRFSKMTLEGLRGVHFSGPHTIEARVCQEFIKDEMERRAIAEASLVVAQTSNIESSKYPGLVCTDAATVLANESILDTAIELKSSSVKFVGSVVALPDDIGKLLPDLTNLECDSKVLCDLPPTIDELAKLRVLLIRSPLVDIQEHIMDLPPGLNGTHGDQRIKHLITIIQSLSERVEALEKIVRAESGASESSDAN